jgi:hypothetical protein
MDDEQFVCLIDVSRFGQCKRPRRAWHTDEEEVVEEEEIMVSERSLAFST